MVDDSDSLNTAPPAGPEQMDDDLRKLALVVIGSVAAIILVEAARWCGRTIERRLARRHPVLTELVEELVVPHRHGH